MKIKYPIGGFAPGNYNNNCVNCGEPFVGDKRAVQCEVCAINSLIESHDIAILKLYTLEKEKEKEEDKLRQMFKNQSDCYADTGQIDSDGKYIEGVVIQAMTEDRFIETLKKTNILPDIGSEHNCDGCTSTSGCNCKK